LRGLTQQFRDHGPVKHYTLVCGNFEPKDIATAAEVISDYTEGPGLETRLIDQVRENLSAKRIGDN
jgi:hypothetical protein